MQTERCIPFPTPAEFAGSINFGQLVKYNTAEKENVTSHTSYTHHIHHKKQITGKS